MTGGPRENTMRHFWFVDTASLLSMAVDPEIAAEVMAEIGSDPVVVIDVVREELTYRATRPGTGALAQTALQSIPVDWHNVDSGRYVGPSEVEAIQYLVADGRPLSHDDQHLAESTIIAMGRQSAQSPVGYASIKVLLPEDYDARRVASTIPQMTALSIHGLLFDRVQGNRMAAARARDLALKLTKAGRGPDVTEEDFSDTSGRGLGRVADPQRRPRGA